MPQAKPVQGALELANGQLLLTGAAFGLLAGALCGFPDGSGGVLTGASEKGAVDQRGGHQRVVDLDFLPGLREDVHQQRLNLVRVSGVNDIRAASRACCAASTRWFCLSACAHSAIAPSWSNTDFWMIFRR